jgi:hypothetical protein
VDAQTCVYLRFLGNSRKVDAILQRGYYRELTVSWLGPPPQAQNMQNAQSKSRSRQIRGVILAIFCVFLIAFSATTQVLHHHGLSNDPHPDCAACVASHAGIFFSAPFELPPTAEYVEAVEADRVEHPRSSFVFSFYSRPPPAEAASL